MDFGVFVDADGNVVISIPNQDYLLVTPVSESKFEQDVLTYEHLEWAFNSILNAENVGELPAAEGTIAQEINDLLASMNAEMTCEDLASRDLFEVTAYGEFVDPFYQEGYALVLTFAADIDPEQPFVVLCSHDSATWHTLPMECVTVNANGTVTLRLNELGTLAFLVNGADYQADVEMVSSPE